MSMDLDELGQQICCEFDHRDGELKTLHTETRHQVKQYRSETFERKVEDSAELRTSCKEVKSHVVQLMDSFANDRRTVHQELKHDCRATRVELNEWLKERGEKVSAWHAAVRYIRQKSKGR